MLSSTRDMEMHYQSFILHCFLLLTTLSKPHNSSVRQVSDINVPPIHSDTCQTSARVFFLCLIFSFFNFWHALTCLSQQSTHFWGWLIIFKIHVGFMQILKGFGFKRNNLGHAVRSSVTVSSTFSLSNPDSLHLQFPLFPGVDQLCDECWMVIYRISKHKSNFDFICFIIYTKSLISWNCGIIKCWYLQ